MIMMSTKHARYYSFIPCGFIVNNGKDSVLELFVVTENDGTNKFAVCVIPNLDTMKKCPIRRPAFNDTGRWNRRCDLCEFRLNDGYCKLLMTGFVKNGIPSYLMRSDDRMVFHDTAVKIKRFDSWVSEASVIPAPNDVGIYEYYWIPKEGKPSIQVEVQVEYLDERR